MPSANAYPYSKVHPRSRREYVDSIRENLSNQGSPRIRGEYEKASGTSGWYYGSPPHPRGISAVLRLLAVDYRFTPASAGNIPDIKNRELQKQVHPRIRGEYNGEIGKIAGVRGSPPHPRGISNPISANFSSTGFTPASAGNILPHVSS